LKPLEQGLKLYLVEELEFCDAPKTSKEELSPSFEAPKPFMEELTLRGQSLEAPKSFIEELSLSRPFEAPKSFIEELKPCEQVFDAPKPLKEELIPWESAYPNIEFCWLMHPWMGSPPGCYLPW